MKKNQRKKSHILLPDDEHAKNGNGNFFICIIRFFLSNSLTYPSAQLPCPLHARLSLYGLFEIPFVVFTSEARKFRSHMRRSSLLRIHSESLIAMRCGKLVFLFSLVYLHWKVKTTTAHRYAFVCQLFPLGICQYQFTVVSIQKRFATSRFDTNGIQFDSSTKSIRSKWLKLYRNDSLRVINRLYRCIESTCIETTLYLND